MKMLLAIALLFGFASFTAAHAEWEILDTGSAVYAGASTNAPATDTAKSAAPATTASGAAKDVAKNNATSN
jgi:hypothetical protein